MLLLCELGIHDWRRKYLSPNSCEVQEICSRCRAIKGPSTVIHKWEWIQQNPCISQQVCKRCGEIGQTDEKDHDWKRIYKPNSFEFQITCERCGKTSTYASGFSKFIGQEEIKPSLITLVAAAHKREEALHHLLLCGQSGMGKVTLAKIIAAEMGTEFKLTSGKTIEKTGDLAAILTNLRAGDFLIIEQIEEMRKTILEILISAMSDFSLEIVIGKGPSARNIKLKLPQFTVVGTTSKPLQVEKRLSNLMFALNFNPYNKAEISKIISLLASQHEIIIELEAASFLAEHCNGRPGEANHVLQKVYKYAIAYSDGQITQIVAKNALAVFGSKNVSPAFERQPIPGDVKIFVWKRDGGRDLPVHRARFNP